MAFISSKPLFQKAYKEGYAVGAFNINDMEILQGITEAIAEEKAPVILQVSAGARKYARHQYLIHLVQAAMECTGIDCVLHLDHGEDFEVCKACVDGGFSSVMIDGSKHSFEDNIKLTKQVVEYAHVRACR
jgi:fructose-bisphosphate aldolase class II